MGLSICYDIRFPALYTELARRGAQLIAVCASWGSGPGKLEQWTLLARARALDSMSYVAAAGQADPGDALTVGSARRADRRGRQPGGLTLGRGGGVGWRRPQLVVADIDVDKLTRLAKTSQYCATTQALLRLIRQNRLGDKPARTAPRGPRPGAVPETKVPSAPPTETHRAATHRRARGGRPQEAPTKPVQQPSQAAAQPVRPATVYPPPAIPPAPPTDRWPRPRRASSGEKKRVAFATRYPSF